MNAKKNKSIWKSLRIPLPKQIESAHTDKKKEDSKNKCRNKNVK